MYVVIRILILATLLTSCCGTHAIESPTDAALENVHVVICDDINYKLKYCTDNMTDKKILNMCIKSDYENMFPELRHYCKFIWNE